jgi:TolB-like protein/tetratricopeptide (TPR) repeat protein/class 3 adenylate cyclase
LSAPNRRRIATLLAADVVEVQQSLTPDALQGEEPFEICQRLVNEHDGRCVSTVGKSLIAEFTNAVSAVHCAVAIQQALLAKNDPLPLDKRVLLRIGLSVGDVIEEDGNLYGIGVDAATALRAMAVPGGICLGGSVYEHAKERVQVGVEFAGEQKVGNNRESIDVYQVVEPGVEKGRVPLWTELRRRNVFRVSVAYAVIAWLLIQVADVVLPTFDAPLWIMRGFISLSILGFPIVVVLAWVYELTPMGLKRSDDVLRQTSIRWITGKRLNGAIMILLVTAVVFLIFDNYISPRLDGGGRQAESIAVLAFENHSRNPEDVYFADGLADELLSVLARIKELKVASRTASFYYKGKDVDIATIAETLNVNDVLSGSVRREGERIRVTAVLDDTETGNVSWTETYDRTMDDVLDIQSDIAQSVANAIVPVMSPESRSQVEARLTENNEAYDLYLRGRSYLRMPAEESTLASAIQLFNGAIDLDPIFAQAYAGLCEAYLGQFEFSQRPESFESAEPACRRALALNDGLWEVHVALGNLYRVNGRYDDAILNLKSALERQPNAVIPYLDLARTYAAQDLPDLAEEMFRKAEEVEGGYWGVHRAYGLFLSDQGRNEEAVMRHLKVTELTPDSGIGFDNLGNTYLALGELDKAEAAFNDSPLPSRWTYWNRGLVYYFRHEFARAVEDQKIAISLAPDVSASWGALADAYRFMPGEEENARAAYEEAIRLAKQQLAINPTDWGAVARVGLYYAYMGRIERAEKEFKKLPDRPSDTIVYFFVARARLQMGDVDGALDGLRKLIESGWSPTLLAADPDFASLRGMVEFEMLMKKHTA